MAVLDLAQPLQRGGGEGAGRGVFPVGAQARRYHVPFEDAPPLRWGLLWRADNATARLRAFAEAAHDLAGTA
ncbi:hypothetical protein [Streptosporangium sandarakinum]|uniref:hypothetical protein n=1 Tax=Streptosporangium sandarakinum TaxID=1260955 RepID=UPI00371D5E78